MLWDTFGPMQGRGSMAAAQEHQRAHQERIFALGASMCLCVWSAVLARGWFGD